MLDKTNNNENSFEDTVTDLEFAMKKARLMHQAEVLSRKISTANQREERIRIQQEIIILRGQIEKMDKERLEGSS